MIFLDETIYDWTLILAPWVKRFKLKYLEISYENLDSTKS